MTGLEDLRLLNAFVRIVETGTISGAARVLNVSQPTLSRQLRQLERAAGVPLLHRDTHTMSLTAAGRTLLEDARSMLALAESASQRLRSEKEITRGHLRLMAVLDFGQWIVPQLLAAFRVRHPRVTMELHLINRPSKFIEEGFDCGVLAGEITDTSVTARKVADLQRILVASPELLGERGLPLGPEELRDWPWMGVLQPHFQSRDHVKLSRGRESHLIRFEPLLLLDSMTALREAAIAGAGLTVQPEWLVGEALASGRLVQILPEWRMPTVDVHVVYRADRQAPVRVRAFVEFAVVHLRQLLEERLVRGRETRAGMEVAG
jgi:DNA-binding transcriptional LysR family regulator